MKTMPPFAHAGFLGYLEQLDGGISPTAAASMPAPLVSLLFVPDGSGRATRCAELLLQLLRARLSVLQAAWDTELAADELRRHQKFAKPGQPSPHIVGLRQKQAAARQASSVAKQSLIKAASGFVREAGVTVPQRQALELFIERWIEANVPKAFVAVP